MGACADLLIEPGSAVGIGGVGGLVSVLGYVYVQPWLEQRAGLHDTCGVNNLHGMPSLVGGFASVIAAAVAHVDGFGGHQGYGRAQLANSYPGREGDAFNGDGRTANEQAAIQFAYMCTTVGIGLLGGLITGHFATLRCFAATATKNMYVDSEYWEVPHLETPYYFSTDTHVANDLAVYTTKQQQQTATAEGEGEDGADRETAKVDGANLNAPDNARLLGLIQTLETRLNQLTRRVGQQSGGGGGGASGLLVSSPGGSVAGSSISPAAASVPLPATTPLTGLSAIPQVHLSKSAAAPGIEADYPPSKLALTDPAPLSPSAAALAPLASVAVAQSDSAADVAAAALPDHPVLLHANDQE